VPPSTKPEQPETLVQSTKLAIIEHIREHNLKVGDKLPSEASFVEQLEVSRTVVREAYKSLVALGIIDMSAGRRAEVSGFDGSVIGLTLTHALRTDQLNVHQVWDARRSIELRSVELAAMHRNDQQLATIQQLCRDMREHFLDEAAITEYDIQFHNAIAEASRNPLLGVLVLSLSSAIRETNPIVWRYRRTEAEQMEIVELHERIAEAISARDPDAAREAMEAHFGVAIAGLAKAGFS
jgi:DNA-binding FadR family transcriptional regulator